MGKLGNKSLVKGTKNLLKLSGKFSAHLWVFFTYFFILGDEIVECG